MLGRKELLVEGKDDMHVIYRICQDHRISGLTVASPGNDIELLKDFPVRIKALRPEDALGIIVDVDADVASRWQSVRNLLLELDYVEVPVQPNPNGTILSPVTGQSLPTVGVWLMPNNQDPGYLEDFLAFLVPPADPHWPHAESCVDSLVCPRFNSVDRSKAVIHTWLAWQADPGRPFGLAIRARFLDSDAPQAQQLADWLRRLFNGADPATG